MIRVLTSSRLHFGLLSLAEEGMLWPDRQGNLLLPARRFGSVGLMVEKPGLGVSAAPAAAWSATGPLANRALDFARRFAHSFPNPLPPHRLVVEQCPPEHVGLGVGTQLGLAVAKALAVSAGLSLHATDLAQRVKRGQRSALGIHGFEQGGFLIDGGKRSAAELAPLLVRVPFPEAWHILLVMPPGETGLHGPAERDAFAGLAHRPESLSRSDALCRLVLLGLLPALREVDLPAFSEALFDFNARVGEDFASVQGGTYTSPLAAELVAFLRARGAPGIGQSSWGPTVFAISDEADRLLFLAKQVGERFALPQPATLVTRASNRGALVC